MKNLKGKRKRKKQKLDDSIANPPSPQTDLILNLPEPIIHHCLSFLPIRDAIRTSILSKKWRSVWYSFPILDFDHEAFRARASLPLPYHAHREMFLKHLSRSIRRCRGRKLSLQKFRLVVDLRERRSDGRLNTAIKFAVQSGAQDLELSICGGVAAVFDPPVSLYLAKSVTVLKLTYFKVDYDNLIQGCPLLEELMLHSCKIPQKIIRLSSVKLRKFELIHCSDVATIIVEEINLICLRYGRLNPGDLYVNTCKSLKILSLENLSIEQYQWLEDAISKLVLLETLELSSYDVKRIKVSHQELRSLKLAVRGKFEIEIDTPKLRYFFYDGSHMPVGLFSSSGVLDVTRSYVLKSDWRDTEATWRTGYQPLSFAKVKQFLLLFTNCEVLNLICDSPKDVTSVAELRENLAASLDKLKRLHVTFRLHPERVKYSKMVKYSESVCNFLSVSPYLETLSIISDHGRISLKFECKKNEELRYCRGVPPEDWWKYYVKKLTVASFSGHNDDKEELLTYFRQNANSLETIQDDSLLALMKT